MKPFRALLALTALAACSMISACTATAPPGGMPDPAAVIQAGVAAADLGILALEQAGRINAVDVARFRAQADAVVALVVAIGPVASLADPKLAPALAALTALQTGIAAARATPAPG